MRSHWKLLSAVLLAAVPAFGSAAEAMAPEIGIDCESCQYPTAVRLPLCTGVYMGNGLVLTAAHCIGNVSESSNAYFGESETGWELAVPIAYCEAHPNGEADTNAWGEESWSGVDLAFCVLEDTVAMPPIVPPMMPAGCERDWLAHETYQTGNGALVTAVGTGCGIHQEYWGQDCEDGTKRFAGQQLLRQTIHQGSATKLELRRDFFGDPDDTGIRSGDSGGPVFVRLPDDTWRLIGVIHGTSAGKAYAEAVPPYLQWVESASGIDVTPHHSFVNGAWVTAIGSALLPRSEDQGWWGNWQFGCAGAPMKVSESYTESPFLQTLQCPGWPALPGDLQVEPRSATRKPRGLAVRRARKRQARLTLGLLGSAPAPGAPSQLLAPGGDLAAPLGFLPVDLGGTLAEWLQAPATERARARRHRAD